MSKNTTQLNLFNNEENNTNMAKFRILHTCFWDDPLIEQLSADCRYCYSFLLVNPLTTECGIYQITLKKIANYMGHNEDSVKALLETLTSKGRLIYDHETNEICLFKKPNYVTNTGKPVCDCIVSELDKVKNIKLVFSQLPHITIPKIKELYETWARRRQHVDNTSARRGQDVGNTCTSRRQEEEEEEERGSFIKTDLLSKDFSGIDDQRSKTKDEFTKLELGKTDEKKVEDKKDRKFANPFSDDFLKTWNEWKDYKKVEHKFHYKSERSENAALEKLKNLSEGNEQIAIAIINESIANGWEGFFKLKNNQNADQTNTANRNIQQSGDYHARRETFFLNKSGGQPNPILRK